MQCGPVRHQVDAKAQAAARPFEHTVLVRPTSFCPLGEADPDKRIQFQQLTRELVEDEARNRLICEEVVTAVWEGRSPLVLTERNAHLDFLADQLTSKVRHVIVLRGGMRIRETRDLAGRLNAIPENDERMGEDGSRSAPCRRKGCHRNRW